MIKAGVIDSTKVVRTALQGAGRWPGFETTEAMVAEVPAKNGPPAMPGGGMGGGDMGFSPPRSSRRGWGSLPTTTGTGGTADLASGIFTRSLRVQRVSSVSLARKKSGYHSRS